MKTQTLNATATATYMHPHGTPKVCQIRFEDLLWSYYEDKLTVLKIVVFQASVHVLPHGLQSCYKDCFWLFFCFVLFFFFIEWHLFGVAALFSNLFLFLFFPLPVPPSCYDLPGSGAIFQCIYISQKKCISSHSCYGNHLLLLSHTHTLTVHSA